MNFTEKGWLKRYLQFRSENLDIDYDYQQIDIDSIENIGQFIYSFIQPTGLMYGIPVDIPDLKHLSMHEWNDQERQNVVLIESFINAALNDRYDDVNQINDIVAETEEIVVSIGLFYSYLYPDIAKARTKIFARKEKEGIELTEYVLEKHVQIKMNWTNFWSSFFDNSLLFLDIVYFIKWLQLKNNKAAGEAIIQERISMHLLILKTIAVVSLADNEIQSEEQKLFDSFVHSAKLDSEKINEVKNYLSRGITLDDIDFSIANTWLLKKYILELAVLTAWSNQDVDEDEKEILLQINTKLGFDEPEFERSMMAIESFVIENWEQVHYLQDKLNYQIVSKRFRKRINATIAKNKKRIITEIQESKELMQLLNKSRKQKLTPEEKAKVKSQILDILKTIPALAIFSLPFGSVILPLVLKILPKHILYPTAFQD